MRKKLATIQIVQTIFIIIILLVTIFERNGIIQRGKTFMPFYFFSCFIYWGILCITLAIIIHKNSKKEQKMLLMWVLLSVEILLLGSFCLSVDNRVDKLEFTKHCKETTATVCNMYKHETREVNYDYTRSKYGSSGTDRVKVSYIYWFKYYVNGAMYEDKFTESHPTYEKGDKLTIYYNTEDPEDWRRSLGYISGKGLNVFELIIIGLRAFILGKTIMDYNKEKKEEKNLV